MATQGKWIIGEGVGLGMFHVAHLSTSSRYRVWNDTNSRAIHVEATRGDQQVSVVIVPGASADIEGQVIRIRRNDSSTAGEQLHGTYENLD